MYLNLRLSASSMCGILLQRYGLCKDLSMFNEDRRQVSKDGHDYRRSNPDLLMASDKRIAYYSRRHNKSFGSHTLYF